MNITAIVIIAIICVTAVTIASLVCSTKAKVAFMEYANGGDDGLTEFTEKLKKIAEATKQADGN